jgi:hypothetical protein
MFSHPYICIATQLELGDNGVIAWMRAVTEAGPPGIIAGAEISPDGDTMQFYKRKMDDGFHYVAALARDLTGDEAMRIADAYSKLISEGDFVVSWSQNSFIDPRPAELADSLQKAIAVEAAKINHNHWVQKRSADGWRFGKRYDQINKTSPMCVSWESLPDSYKYKELQRMASLVEVLEKMNLMITRK